MSIFTPARRVLYAPPEAGVQVPFIIDRHRGVLPSYATDFAHNAGESEYPECWKGLVGFWPFFLGQTGNKVFDLSGNGRDGTLNGGLSWKSAKYGSGIDFPLAGLEEVATDYIDIGTLPTMTEWSIGVVFKPDDVTGSGSKAFNILSNDRGGWNDDVLFGICPEDTDVNTDKRIVCSHQDSTDSARTTVEDTVDAVVGRWYHAVATSDGSSLRLYVDGILKATTAKNGAALTFDGAPTFIGATPNVSRYFNGLIDHISVYNRALSAGEIAFLHQNPTALVQLRRRVVMVNIEIGGEAFLRTINDGIGIADVMSRTQALSRTITDGVGTADDMGRTQIQARTLAEAMGLTDSLWTAQTRIIADAVGITDAITKTQAFARTIADDIELVDTKGWFGVNGTNHLISNCGSEDNRNCYEALDGTDSWQHTVNHNHEFILDLGAVHNITKLRGRSFAAAAMDPIKVTVYVSLTNGNWGEAVATDIAVWQDTAVWQEVDCTDKKGRFVRVVITETEAVYIGMIWGRSVAPFKIFDVYYDDAITRIMTYARTLTEALVISDAQTVSRGDVRTVSDGIGITDSVTRTVVFARVVADAMGIEDVVTRTQVQLRTIADAIGLVDAMAPGMLIVFSEAMGITDAMTHTKTQIRVFAEAMGITDDLTRIAAYIFTQADDVGIADAMVRVAVALRTVSDDVGMTDEMSSQIGDLVKAAWAFMLIRQTHN